MLKKMEQDRSSHHKNKNVSGENVVAKLKKQFTI